MAIDTTSEQKAREALDQNPLPDVPWIRIRDDGIAFLTGYSEALHRLLRWVPKAEWRPADRCWLVPFSGTEAIRAVLPEITRLAEAARDLDAASPRAVLASRERDADRRAIVAEAAALLYGSDSQRSPDFASIALSDRSMADLAGRLREKAASLMRAAERLEAELAATGPEP